MTPNLLMLNEKSFEELCQALLSEEFPRFRAFSPPDLGVDGYDPDSCTIFQCYFPEREPRKDKVVEDLEKAKRQGSACRKWVLVLPKNPTAPFARWLKTDQQASCPFLIEVWGKTEILRFLRNHPKVRAHYFPSETQELVKEIARGKVPRAGDATPGEEISAAEAAELRQIMTKTAEEEAERKGGRKPRDRHYSREFGEFKAHYNLSAYDRLPREKFAEARRYLEVKLCSGHNKETRSQERYRCIKGVKAIQRKLAIPDARYREILVQLTGKDSLAIMDNEGLRRVFRHFQELQGEAEAIA
jgi:hypothetical protein